MNQLLPIPDPLGVPAAVWLLKGLLLLTFVLHLIVMNLFLGGSLVTAWHAWHGRTRHPAARVSPVTLLPVAAAFTITSGVAPLLFSQLLYGQSFYAACVLMAWPWLSVVALLLLAYYGCYGLGFSLGRPGRFRWLAAGVAVLTLAIAVVFAANALLTLRPGDHLALYRASDRGLHLDLLDAALWPRVLHVVVASLALTGIGIGWIGQVRRRRDEAAGLAMRRSGIRLFAGATLIQVPVGVWFLFSQPAQVREVFFNTPGPDLVLLGTGIGFAALAIVAARRSLALASLALLIAVADMAVVRDRVRTIHLEGYFSVESLRVVPQMGAFVLFAALLVAGLGVVGWMIWRFAAACSAVAPADREAAGV